MQRAQVISRLLFFVEIVKDRAFAFIRRQWIAAIAAAAGNKYVNKNALLWLQNGVDTNQRLRRSASS